jgi:hypothetical protein
MGILASLLFLVTVGVGGYFVFGSVATCSICKEAGLLPALDEESPTLA